MKNKFKNKFTTRLFILIIIFLIYFIIENLIIFAQQNESKSLSVGGKIISYYKCNLNEDIDDEFIIIYKNIFKKKIFLAIYKFQGNNFIKIFDEQVEDFYFCFSLARFESKNYYNLIFLGKNSILYLNLKENKIIKLFDIDHIYRFNFEDQFPYISINNDIENDGKDEFFIFDESGLLIYKEKQLIQKVPIDIKSFYDYSLSFGGFNVIHTITIILPDINFIDLNNDGYLDFVLVFQDYVISYLWNDKNKKFIKSQELNLKNYVTIRAGYSPINKYIIIDDFNGDKFNDIIVLNFSMAAVFNVDKLGTILYIFYGNNDGLWKEQPDKKIHLNEISGIESYFIFYDINKDGVKDLINIGTKLFSSNFILNLTVKRSFLIGINIYLIDKDGNINNNPLYNLSKNISLDSETTQDSTQIDFSSYSSLNLQSFFNSIFTKFDCDLNNDGINDLLIYNFDGTYSIFYSNSKNPNIYNKKEDKIIFISNELKKIYYLAGPYTEIIISNNKYYLIVINKSSGKLFYINL